MAAQLNNKLSKNYRCYSEDKREGTLSSLTGIRNSEKQKIKESIDYGSIDVSVDKNELCG